MRAWIDSLLESAKAPEDRLLLGIMADLDWVIYWNKVCFIDRKKSTVWPIKDFYTYLGVNKIYVKKSRVSRLIKIVLYEAPNEHLKGLVLREGFQYAELGEYKGLFSSTRGNLIFVGADEVKIFEPGKWPKGVYKFCTYSPVRDAVNIEGKSVEPLFKYFYILGHNLAIDWRIACAMFLPPIFNQGHACFFLYGPSGIDEVFFAKGLGYLQRGAEWGIPVGCNMKDYLAILPGHHIVYFDGPGWVKGIVFRLLKSLITIGEIIPRNREDYWRHSSKELSRSVVIVCTHIERPLADLAENFLYVPFTRPRFFISDQDLEAFYKNNWKDALAGALCLFQKAARVRVPENLLPSIKYRDWAEWAYRYATVLGVADKFVNFVEQANGSALAKTTSKKRKS